MDRLQQLSQFSSVPLVLHAVKCSTTRTEATIYWRLLYAPDYRSETPDEVEDVTRAVSLALYLSPTDNGYLALPSGTSLVSEVSQLLSTRLKTPVRIQVVKQ